MLFRENGAVFLKLSANKDMAKVSKINIVDLSGKKKGSVEVPECLNIEVSPLLLAQALHTHNKRTRVRRAHTKERAQVRGGGRKPWRQKGTGHSRHGSRRSPIWVGGGTTFGPTSRHERVIRMPRGMRVRALAGGLQRLVAMGDLSILKSVKDFPVKTKDLAGMLPEDMRGLMVIATPGNAAKIERVSRNIPEIRVVSADRVTTADVLAVRAVWVMEDAWDAVLVRCGEDKKEKEESVK